MHIPDSHNDPLYPDTHVQLKEKPLFAHVPPLVHGPLRHEFKSGHGKLSLYTNLLGD